jgi:hypothetical protein
MQGLLLACASKASSHQPLLLAPMAALAAALEGQKQHASAAAALRYCLALLQTALQRGPEGSAALGLGLGRLQDGGHSLLTHRLLLLQPAAAGAAADAAAEELPQGASVVDDAQAVSTALELALARNLALDGSYQEAAGLYQKLEAEGALSSSAASVGDACSWLCYGHAAQQSGQAALAMRALQAAIDCAPDGAVKLAAVTAVLQVGAGACWAVSRAQARVPVPAAHRKRLTPCRCCCFVARATQHHLHQGALEDAFALLLQDLPAISSSSPSLASACTRPWLSLMVAAAAAGSAELQDQVAEVMRQCAEGQQQHVDMAWVSC